MCASNNYSNHIFTSKLLIGDKVIVVDGDNDNFIAKTGKIIDEDYDYGEYYYVRFDTTISGFRDWWVSSKVLKKIDY